MSRTWVGEDKITMHWKVTKGKDLWMILVFLFDSQGKGTVPFGARCLGLALIFTCIVRIKDIFDSFH